jgi:LysR family glycine cleavage system transcriptional activator
MLLRLPSLSALRAFESAARNLSFTKAAQEIFTTQSAVSYQIRILEEALGVTLFARERRTVVLTPEGKKLLPAVQRGFGEIEGGIASLRAGKGKRILNVALSTYFATHWLSRRLAGFLRDNADIQLRLQHPETSPQHVDRGEVDLGIFWRPVEWKAPAGIDARLLFEAPVTPVCSPGLNRRPHSLRTPKDLRKHVLLRDEITENAWNDWLALAGIEHSEQIPEMSINDPNVYIQAAIDGQGIALADNLVSDEIRLKRLIMPFALEMPGYGYFVASKREAQKHGPVRKFREWLISEAAAANDGRRSKKVRGAP